VKCETEFSFRGRIYVDGVSEQIAGGILGLGGMKCQRDKGNYKVRSFTVCTLHLMSLVRVSEQE
jgi:hypothetical protein